MRCCRAPVKTAPITSHIHDFSVHRVHFEKSYSTYGALVNSSFDVTRNAFRGSAVFGNSPNHNSAAARFWMSWHQAKMT